MQPKRTSSTSFDRIIMKGWLLKFIFLCLGLFLVLKASQTWLFTPSAWLERVDFDSDTNTDPFRDDYFYHDHDPNVKTQRCDACRLIAQRFDTAFETAESKLPDDREELNLSEVSEIVNFVCSTRTFTTVQPFQMRDYHRLAAKGLETWNYWQKVSMIQNQDSLDESTKPVDWPQRLSNHCQYFAEKLQGLDIYDMWLRTSAGSREGYETFLCYGEAIFGDCLEWIPHHEKWPAGDEALSINGEEDSLGNMGENFQHLEEIAMVWERPTNSAPSFYS